MAGFGAGTSTVRDEFPRQSASDHAHHIRMAGPSNSQGGPRTTPRGDPQETPQQGFDVLPLVRRSEVGHGAHVPSVLDREQDHGDGSARPPNSPRCRPAGTWNRRDGASRSRRPNAGRRAHPMEVRQDGGRRLGAHSKSAMTARYTAMTCARPDRAARLWRGVGGIDHPTRLDVIRGEGERPSTYTLSSPRASSGWVLRAPMKRWLTSTGFGAAASDGVGSRSTRPTRRAR